MPFWIGCTESGGAGTAVVGTGVVGAGVVGAGTAVVGAGVVGAGTAVVGAGVVGAGTVGAAVLVLPITVHVVEDKNLVQAALL